MIILLEYLLFRQHANIILQQKNNHKIVLTYMFIRATVQDDYAYTCSCMHKQIFEIHVLVTQNPSAFVNLCYMLYIYICVFDNIPV